MALGRLKTAAFGTLMALEPALALLIGFVVLHQIPHAQAIVASASSYWRASALPAQARDRPVPGPLCTNGPTSQHRILLRNTADG